MGVRSKKDLLYGVGINDADYPVSTYIFENGKKIQKLCPFYAKWKDMLRRCYSSSYHRANSGFVIEDWHRFSVFKAWMEKQDWEGNQLDKDILVVGNKLYSPETCAFIPKRINMLIGKINPSASFSGFIGVTVEKRTKRMTYRAEGSKLSFKDAATAHKFWQLRKANHIEQAVSWYSNCINFNTRIAEALTSRVWKLRLENLKSIKTVEV